MLTTRTYRMEGPKQYRQIGVQEPTGVAVSEHHFAELKYREENVGEHTGLQLADRAHE